MFALGGITKYNPETYKDAFCSLHFLLTARLHFFDSKLATKPVRLTGRAPTCDTSASVAVLDVPGSAGPTPNDAARAKDRRERRRVFQPIRFSTYHLKDSRIVSKPCVHHLRLETFLTNRVKRQSANCKVGTV